MRYTSGSDLGHPRTPERLYPSLYPCGSEGFAREPLSLLVGVGSATAGWDWSGVSSKRRFHHDSRR